MEPLLWHVYIWDTAAKSRWRILRKTSLRQWADEQMLFRICLEGVQEIYRTHLQDVFQMWFRLLGSLLQILTVGFTQVASMGLMLRALSLSRSCLTATLSRCFCLSQYCFSHLQINFAWLHNLRDILYHSKPLSYLNKGDSQSFRETLHVC